MGKYTHFKMITIVNGRNVIPMNMCYEDVMRRLREERLSHGLSQEDLSRRIMITQGHYSKAEQAVKRFTYFEIKGLAEAELDLYYIYTGCRSGERYRSLLGKCSYGELLCYLHMLISLTCCLHEEKKLNLGRDYYRQLCRVRYITGTADTDRITVFLQLRQYEGQNQHEMAECLGMDVKKYRELERGALLPDSELIFKLYSLYQIPPDYVLKDTRGLQCEIESRMERAGAGQNDVVYKYFSLLHEAFYRD